MPEAVVIRCGPERAAEVHALTQAAFERHRDLDPPSGALRESVEVVREDLDRGGGAVALVEGRAVGCLRCAVSESGDFHVRRVAVEPALQRCGIGRLLMAWAEDEARANGCEAVTAGVRVVLPGNLSFYTALGYAVVGEQRHAGYDRTTWLALRKRVRR